MLLQWSIGMLADRLGGRRVLWCLSLAVASLAAGVFLLSGYGAMRWLLFLYVSLAFCIYGVANSMVNDGIPAVLRVETSAVLLLAFAAGGLLGPVVVSSAMALWGYSAYFPTLMLLCLLLPLALRYASPPRDAAPT